MLCGLQYPKKQGWQPFWYVGLAFLYFQHMLIPGQAGVALVEGADLATVDLAVPVVVDLATVASAVLVVAVLIMVALVAPEEVFLVVDSVAHVEVRVAPVVGVAARGVAAAGEGARGAAVGTVVGEVARGAGGIRIMVGAMAARGDTLIGVVVGAGGLRLCSVLCLA